MAQLHVTEWMPGYALGILDEADSEAVSQHLSQCDTCRKEMETWFETTRLLDMAVSQPAPGPDLKSRVLKRVNGASVPHSSLQNKSASPPGELPRKSFLDSLREIFTHPAGLAFGILALLLIPLLGINNYLLWQRVNNLQARLPSGNMQIVKLEGSSIAPRAVGYVMVFKDQNYGSLALTQAPLLDTDHQYQIWLIKDGKRTSGGVFSVNDDGYGNLEVSADRPLDSFQSFGITIEPRGGSPQPTGERVLGGEL
jgi:anti-sigma-K factor RskA